MSPALAKQYFERADALFQEGKAKESLALLDTLDEAFPNTKNILFARSLALAALGRREDALALCDVLIRDFDAPKFRALRASICSATTEKPRANWRFRFALLAAGTAAIAGAGYYAHGIYQSGIHFATPSYTEKQEYMRERAAGAAIRDEQARLAEEQRQKELLEKARAPVTEPGREHSAEEWQLTAVDGFPDWKAGAYRDVPCINAPERPLDIYLPLAYQNDPEALFPAVVIQDATPTPQFYGLETWAESRDVVLIAIKSSHNGTFENNYIAQDHALQTVSVLLRVDQRLGFAIGASGGARSSWRMVMRYPNNFRGIVMLAMAGYWEGKLPTHVRIGYVHGDQEPSNTGNNSGIYWEIPKLRERGHQVWEIVVPGGHVAGPPLARIQMLEWMLRETRREFGLPNPDTPLPDADGGL